MNANTDAPLPAQPALPESRNSSAPPRDAAAARERNAALDFTKGALVLCMVLYHCFNYFHHDKDILKYLHFLPPSFIFIAGFLVTNIYLARYDVGDPRMHRRLFVRGFKLLLIFIGLNLAVHTLFSVNYNRRQLGLDFLFDHLDSIFITGEERAAVFEVLLPISYLLLLSGVLLKGCRIFRYFLHLVAGAAIAVCLILAFQGRLVFNLELLSMGLLGMVVGFIPLRRIDHFAGHFLSVLIAYLAYVAVISYWYPVYALNIIGICLTLLLLYGLGVKVGDRGFIQRRIILLGRYSLLAYIVQIAVLQVLSRGLRYLALGGDNLIIGLIATSILTAAIIESVDYLRAQWTVLDRAYKALFA
jgi:hypothetical protein